MSNIIQETTTTERRNVDVVVGATEGEATTSESIGYLIYFFFGLIQVLLFFRILLMLTGANRSSSFVELIYGITGIFVLPFQGIFRSSVSQGVETSSVFEPAAIVAIIVYPLLAFGIVKLFNILKGKKQVE